jgi:hypothetical protein
MEIMKLRSRPQIQRQKKAHKGIIKDYEERTRKEEVEVRNEQRNVNRFEA